MEENIRQLENLYRQHGLEILGYLSRHFSAAGSPEDLLQETFVQALKHREDMARASLPKSWLMGIARNVSLMALRRRKIVFELPPEISDEKKSDEDPRLETMRMVINNLPNDQREILEFRLAQRLSYEEIAVILQIPIGTVRSRLHYTVQQLKEQMQLKEKEGS